MTQIKLIPITPTKPFGDIPKLMATLNNSVRDQVAEGVRYMSQYPPKPGGSAYRRTGTLKRSWAFAMKTGGGRIEGTIGSSSNVAPYNREVQGEAQLRLFKRIGWRNIKTLLNKIAKEFPRRVEVMVERAFR